MRWMRLIPNRLGLCLRHSLTQNFLCKISRIPGCLLKCRISRLDLLICGLYLHIRLGKELCKQLFKVVILLDDRHNVINRLLLLCNNYVILFDLCL